MKKVLKPIAQDFLLVSLTGDFALAVVALGYEKLWGYMLAFCLMLLAIIKARTLSKYARKASLFIGGSNE